MTATGNEKLAELLREADTSKTIYAYVMPETEAMLDRILDGGIRREIIEKTLTEEFKRASTPDPVTLAAILDRTLREARDPFHAMYREAWTQKQDSMHEEFFATWLNWIKPVVNLEGQKFPFVYPTAGASEGLREAIEHYGVTARAAGRTPVIHVFEGEYEGFTAYARAARIDVVTHKRSDWREAVRTTGHGDQFYISQPSAIDGNIWGEFEEFAAALAREKPGADLILDLTYVGCVARDFKINAEHDNIKTVFFSLSKPTGSYYHRIGGCLSREEYPGLFGNKWFKNLLALKLGTEMMKAYGVHDLPRKYAPVQQRAVDDVNRELALDLKASDVYLLGTAAPSAEPMDLERYLMRGPAGEEIVRACLTPRIAAIVNPSLNGSVKPRAHETLPERKLSP